MKAYKPPKSVKYTREDARFAMEAMHHLFADKLYGLPMAMTRDYIGETEKLNQFIAGKGNDYEQE